MLVVNELPRQFVTTHKGQKITLDDPNPDWSPDAVLNFYANTYPELLSAKLEGPTFDNDAVVYTCVVSMGTKG